MQSRKLKKLPLKCKTSLAKWPGLFLFILLLKERQDKNSEDE